MRDLGPDSSAPHASPTTHGLTVRSGGRSALLSKFGLNIGDHHVHLATIRLLIVCKVLTLTPYRTVISLTETPPGALRKSSNEAFVSVVPEQTARMQVVAASRHKGRYGQGPRRALVLVALPALPYAATAVSPAAAYAPLPLPGAVVSPLSKSGLQLGSGAYSGLSAR